MNEDALWALTFIEAHERQDAEGVAALLADLTIEVAAARLAGMATGLLVHYCMVAGVSPKVWAQEMRTALTGIDAA